MKKVIIPTDFSLNAQKAIAYALDLFKNETCTFYILHGYHNAPSSSMSKSATQKSLDILIKSLELQTEDQDFYFEGILKTESVLNLTNQTQNIINADFVIIGTRGASSLTQLFIGSNALGLIEHLENSALIIVPPEYENANSKEIVFATDYKHTFTNTELNPLIQLVKLTSSTLNIAHVKTEESLNEEQHLNKELLRNILKATKHHFFEIELQDNIANTLYLIEKEYKSLGTMVILKTKHGFFKQLFRENIIKSLSEKTKIPLLVLPLTK
ncbi:universal stress protein [Maribacter ulvicola]|uniref:Nucleotide-binding universal stress protein, UspA family n=1 Tax=Maribacter ulvicola TaxID=228959 RepID=A0A1N6Z2X3_9FLAO|nr:universal stress protein [Maribacter ulvicola]SIR21188.1 Nucleotide-binding universal stress protein, UspA family [Maribacter ulvicola]